MWQPQSETKMPFKPLHPSIIPKLDPEYVQFHNACIQYLPLIHSCPWNPAVRDKASIPRSAETVEVGKVQDYNLTHTNFRAYTPPGEKPESGWPLLIFFHGGGWVLGRIDSESSFVSRMCINANCVVISVNYRLAPENPYPAAVEDAIESLQWVVQHGKDKLNIDLTRIVVGGRSSGGNLAAVLALKAPSITPALRHPLILQLLIVPLTDNTSTATTHASWKTYEHAPLLNPKTVLWYKQKYLPDEAKRSEWLASPVLAPEEVLRGAPKTWIAVAEVDILRDDAERYAEKLKTVGVSVKVICYEKVPHMIVSLDDALSTGKKLVQAAENVLRETFWGPKHYVDQM